MVCIYCTYLTFSAVAMEPDDKHCNPLVRASPARRGVIILGAIITFVTCAYTTTRAATYGLALGSAKPSGYLQVGQDDDEHGLQTRQPDERRELRNAALRSAVAAGSLPASALDEPDSEDDEEEGKRPRDDERTATQYNYTLFHVIFLLSTMWIATLLTQNVSQDKPSEAFTPVGRTYFNSWTKIVSSWVCYVMFGWTLVAPVLMPDRFDY